MTLPDAWPPEERWIGTVRDQLDVCGPDAERYLHSQLSQAVAGMEPGDQRWSLLLEPAGKVVALVRVRRVDAERFVLDVDPGFGGVVEARLARFLIRTAATIELHRAAGAADRDEAARIGAGWPSMGAEIVPGETIPAALGRLEHLVSFTKGCYPGQELVERMDARGSAAPRHQQVAEVPEGTAAGDDIDLAGRVARVTSVAGTTAIVLAPR